MTRQVYTLSIKTEQEKKIVCRTSGDGRAKRQLNTIQNENRKQKLHGQFDNGSEAPQN